MTNFSTIPLAAPSGSPASKEALSRTTAEKLEASFLAEMLKHAGMGEQENSFSGGIGEDQFISFQRQVMAEHLVKSGGVGLAEQIFKTLMEYPDER